LYRLVHDALVAELTGHGLPAKVHASAGTRRPAREPFLCFERRAEGDVVLADHKIMGSAQRRSHAAILQHGSLLLKRSPFAPSLPGLLDLADRPLDLDELLERWIGRIARALHLDVAARSLDASEREQIHCVAAARYATERWNRRR
jgi:lipoate-protein ligase A